MRRGLFVLVVCLLATVSRMPYCVGALHAQAQGQSPEMPPPGNPDHVEPAKGAWCDRTDKPEHHCECHIECVEGDDGQVSLTGITNCRAYCFENACRCPAKNCKTPTTPTRTP